MAELPLYPDFRKLERSDKSVVDQALRQDPPEISEFTFTNFFSWDPAYNFQVSAKDGFILFFSRLRAGDFFYQPIGRGDKRPVIGSLLERGAVFTRVSEAVAGLFAGDERFLVSEERHNFDYLYLRRDLVDLAGRKYDGKRNFIRRFKANFRYSYAPLVESDLKDCLEFIEDWCKVKDCASVESLGQEKAAFRTMLENFEFLGLTGASIRVDGKICAVAIAEPLASRAMVIHVLKARDDMTGLYPAMLNEFLKNSSPGMEYINMEQDLGVEGLRKSKTSYQPFRLVKKFGIKKAELK